MENQIEIPRCAPALPQTNALLGQYATTAKERELLDKAVIGMAAMVELVDAHRAARQAAATSTDPEALANESLDLIQAMANAAHAERARIVALMRDEADSITFAYPQREALLEMAGAIEAGRGPRS